MKFCNHLIIIFLITSTACTSNRNPVNDQLVAQAAGNSLYISDIQEEYKYRNPEQLDSIRFFKSYTERWIKRQLLVKLIENKLSPQELDLTKELENYREELLIYKFNEKNIENISNTEISDVETLKYFNQNKSKFLLNYPIVQAVYLIFPKETNIPLKFRQQILSNRENDLEACEEFISKSAKKYDNFNKTWVYLDNLFQIAGERNFDETSKMQQNRIIEFYSGNDLHLIAIKKMMNKGEQAPVEFVSPQIRSMLINKEKLDFLREIKDSLYQDALKYNKFSVFNK